MTVEIHHLGIINTANRHLEEVIKRMHEYLVEGENDVSISDNAVLQFEHLKLNIAEIQKICRMLNIIDKKG